MGGGKIPGNAVLEFTLELIKIKGDSVAAFSCPVQQVYESGEYEGDDCSEKVVKYINKMKSKAGEGEAIEILNKEMIRIESIIKDSHKVNKEAKNWGDTRILILKDMVEVLKGDVKSEL